MAIRYYDSKKLAAIFEVDIRKFHTEIKPYIIRDFKHELDQKNIKNPDIGIDENNYIYLANTEHTIYIATMLDINNYKDDK